MDWKVGDYVWIDTKEYLFVGTIIYIDNYRLMLDDGRKHIIELSGIKEIKRLRERE